MLYIGQQVSLKNVRSALYQVRAKWRNIGIELEIDFGTLDDIEKSYRTDNNECLSRMLEHWLKQANPRPSWDAIVEALESSPVGEGCLAKDIRQEYCKPLRDKSSDVCPPSSDESNRSTAITAFFPSSQYRAYLRALYTSSILPPDNKWPPTPSTYYINLACIDKCSVHRHEADEFTRYSMKGDIDDICHKKEPVSMEKVACMQQLPTGCDSSDVEVSYPKLVLVGGAPGVGKSTFAWEICRRWARGKLLQHYSFVVLLRLRDGNVRKAKVLADMLFCQQKSVSESVAFEMYRNNGEGVLFLLEGFDELPEDMRVQSSLYLDLIYGRILPLATILLTSRPWAISDLRWKCKERVSQYFEILGFTKQQIDKYLISASQGDAKLLDELRCYMSFNPPIHAAMYIPLNAAIVFDVYKDRRGHSNCVIPNTMTELYTAFSITLLIRHLGEQEQRIRKIPSFEALPKELYRKFLTVCKLASDGINNNEQLIFTDLPDDFQTLGFMQSVPELHISTGVSVSYNFLHLTLQEFLAAYHLSLLPDEVAIKNVKPSVARFLIGITKLKNPIILRNLMDPLKYDVSIYMVPSLFDIEKGLYLHVEENKVCGDNSIKVSTCYEENQVVCHSHVVVRGFKWFYESQNKEQLQALVGKETAFLEINSAMTPMECFAAEWCIGYSSCKWQLLFNEVSDKISQDCIEMLHAGIRHCIHPSTGNEIIELYIAPNSSSETIALKTFQNSITFNVRKLVCLSSYELPVNDSYIPQLCTLIEKSLVLENVTLECDCQDVRLLDVVFASKSITTLRLGGRSLSELFMNRCSSDSVSLTFISLLQSLRISNIDLESAKVATSLIKFNLLKVLDIRLVHGLSDSLNPKKDEKNAKSCSDLLLPSTSNLPYKNGRDVVFHLLQESTTLETFNLFCWGLIPQDTAVIAEAVKDNKILHTLAIESNLNLHSFADLHTVSMYHYCPGIVEMLKVNRTLQVLRITGFLSLVDTDSLFQVFAKNENSTLHTLDVSGNCYSVNSLENMLLINNSLKCLEITVTGFDRSMEAYERGTDFETYYSQKGTIRLVGKNETISSVCSTLVAVLNKSVTLCKMIIHTEGEEYSFGSGLLVSTIRKCQGYHVRLNERIQIIAHDDTEDKYERMGI